MTQRDPSDQAASARGYSRRQLLGWAAELGGILALSTFVVSQFASPWRVTGCTPTGDLPWIDTSDHFDTTLTGSVYRVAGATETNYDVAGPPLPDDPDELLVHVHGWRNGRTCGIARIETASETYHEAGYDHSVTGLTWDAGYAWWNAKEIATRNGPKLATFLTDYARDNPETSIRLQAHSLGARVVAEALEALRVAEVTDVVSSVVLLGPAIPAESVATDGQYGPAIETSADHVETFWMEDDAVLGWLYGLFEPGVALGATGCQGQQPANYTDHEVYSDVDHGEYYSDVAVIERVLETFATGG